MQLTVFPSSSFPRHPPSVHFIGALPIVPNQVRAILAHELDGAQGCLVTQGTVQITISAS